jgi:hypothetical protein
VPLSAGNSTISYNVPDMLLNSYAIAPSLCSGHPNEPLGSPPPPLASLAWPHPEGAPLPALSGGGASKVERDFLGGLRTATNEPEQLRSPEGGALGPQAVLTLGRAEGGYKWEGARAGKEAQDAGEMAGGKTTSSAAAEQLVHLKQTLQVGCYYLWFSSLRKSGGWGLCGC